MMAVDVSFDIFHYVWQLSRQFRYGGIKDKASGRNGGVGIKYDYN